MKTPAGQSLASVEYDMTQRIVNKPNPVETYLINLIKQIQLDAYKAGMSEAAKLNKHKHEHIKITEFRVLILSERDRKTSL